MEEEEGMTSIRRGRNLLLMKGTYTNKKKTTGIFTLEEITFLGSSKSDIGLFPT